MSPDDPLVRGFGLLVQFAMLASGVFAVGLTIGGTYLVRRGSRVSGFVMIGFGLFSAIDLFLIGRTIGAW